MGCLHADTVDSDMHANPGGIGLILTAVGGMFVVSLLDVAGVISNSTPLGLAVNYGLFGACGGMLAYALIRSLSK